MRRLKRSSTVKPYSKYCIWKRFGCILGTTSPERLGGVRMEGDGNCVFRAISYLVYGTQEAHILIRQYHISLIMRLPLIFEPMFTPVTLGKTCLTTLPAY